jgi:UDP-2-acetamido-3-amino-2,3-dideoxy-glucuronate N-acetyltransferase
MSRFGERLDLPLEGDAEIACPNSADRYRLAAGVLSLVA